MIRHWSDKLAFVLYSDMDIRDQRSYQEFGQVIDKSIEDKANLLIITLPGTGMGRFVKEYLAEKGDKAAMILNYDWVKADEILTEIDEKLNSIALDKKVVLTLNFPSLLNDKRLTSRKWWNHFYKRYYFGVRDFEDGKKAIKEMNSKLPADKIEKIYKLSGGFAQIMKYLAINGIDAREGLEAIIKPIVEAISGTNNEIRQKLGLNLKGSILQEWLKTEDWLINIDFELNLIEEGKVSAKLTPVEAKILTKMMSNSGKLTKEEVSEIKWGEGKYDEYSDQAINKAMRRLGDKLKKYQIETIAKVGFVLKRK